MVCGGNGSSAKHSSLEDQEFLAMPLTCCFPIIICKTGDSNITSGKYVQSLEKRGHYNVKLVFFFLLTYTRFHLT